MRRGFLPVLLFWAVSVLCFSQSEIPARIKIQPLFFVPQNEQMPTKEQRIKLIRHLKTAQMVYKKMLNGRDTFELSDKPVLIHRGQHPLEYYERSDGRSMSLSPIKELFEAYGYDRFTCPYIYVIVFMNSKEDFPAAGGRPFNRGFNNGGGLVYLSSYGLDHNSHFQSTLLHEMGHSFGLVHADAYGYDMNTNPSVMSYNQDNWWDGFRVKNRPGELIPEDLRALNYNKRVFPAFRFNPDSDIPEGYRISSKVVMLAGLDDVPGQKPFEVIIKTACPELKGSKAQNIVHKMILPVGWAGESKGIKGFDAESMWMTKIDSSVWGTVDIHFPIPVQLTKICIHSDCGNRGYRVNKVKVQAIKNNEITDLSETDISLADNFVSFAPCATDYIRVLFQVGSSGEVVFRGIRFFTEAGEIFCPDYPVLD